MKENRERARAYQRAYYKRNRKKILAQARRRKQKRREREREKARKLATYGQTRVPADAFTKDEAVLLHARRIKEIRELKKKGLL